MTMLGHMLPGWHCRSSLTWDIRLFYIHHILLISHPLNTFLEIFFKYLDSLCQKIFSSEEKIETVFKDFLAALKPLQFYHTGINNLVNQW